jgi:glycosyltransferase involved in cell wall biosynthesis
VRHVAVVVPSLTGAGAEQVARTLAREFSRTEQVTVVTMAPAIGVRGLRRMDQMPWSDRVPAACAHVHLASTGSGVRRLCQLVPRFAALARSERFDAVYSFLTWTNVLVAAARPMRGNAYVHVASEHALAESLRSDGLRFRLLSRTLPLAYRVPDWLVVVSDAARRSLLAAGVLPRPERVVTIPNPVDAPEIRRLAQLGPPDWPPTWGKSARVVACFARLHPQKDHVTLLRAMTLLPSTYVLLAAGDGPLREDLEALVGRLALNGRVLFTGGLANPYPLMRQSDVVVLPSREEGFGLVAVEAAALGVPFVGSDVGGLAEVAAAIERLASQPRPGAIAEDLAARLFSPPDVARRYLSLAARPVPPRVRMDR